MSEIRVKEFRCEFNELAMCLSIILDNMGSEEIGLKLDLLDKSPDL